MATKKTTKTTAARKAPAKAPAAKTETDAERGAKATAKSLIDQVKEDQVDVHLANPSEEEAMRREATSPAAVKKALAEGKKNPIEKWGDPDANPDEIGARRAMGGF